MARNGYRLYGCMGKPLRPLETILGALEGKSVDVWGVGSLGDKNFCSAKLAIKKPLVRGLVDRVLIIW